MLEYWKSKQDLVARYVPRMRIMQKHQLTLGERNSAFLTIVEWNAPGQKRLGLKKCLNNWLWMKRSAQLGGKGASILSKSGPHGISKRISSSGGLSLFATTAVGRTSIWGMRILPDWRTLWCNANKMWAKNDIVLVRVKEHPVTLKVTLTQWYPSQKCHPNQPCTFQSS